MIESKIETKMNSNHWPYNLSVVIPALNEADNLADLLPKVRHVLGDLRVNYQVIIVDECANEATQVVVGQNDAELLCPDTKGYGSALLSGLNYAQGEFVVSMDADFSHPPDFLRDLWEGRYSADILIASRYVKGGQAIMPLSRYALSRILNLFFSRGLGLKVLDMSSGYRMYQSKIIKSLSVDGRDFEILQEILVRAVVQGFTIREIPFTYRPRQHGSSHARVLKFGIAYLKAFTRLWRLRNFAPPG